MREFFAHRFDPETRHVLLQYVAAMIDRILRMAGDSEPRITLKVLNAVARRDLSTAASSPHTHGI
jgi:hypothetical protein